MRGLWRLRGYLLQQRGTLALAAVCMVLLALSGASLAYLCGPALRLVFAGGAQVTGELPQAGAQSGASRALARMPALLAAWTWLRGWLPAQASFASSIWAVPLAIVCNAVVKASAQAGQFYAMGRVSLHVQAGLRRDVFAALMRRPPAYFNRNRQGDLLSRLLGDTTLIEQGIFYGLGSVVRDALALVALLGFCAYSDAKLAVYTLITGPLVALPLLLFSRSLKRFVRRSQTAQGEVANRCHEALQGIATVQACQREAHEEARLAAAEGRRAEQMRRSYAVRALRTPTMEVLGALGLAGLLGLLGYQVQRHGADSAHYISFFAALMLMYDPIKKLGNVADYLAQAEAAEERLSQVLQAKEQVVERPGARPLPANAGDVHFDRVSFAYGAAPVLRQIDLRLPRGARVAVVGESGAGKSTLAHLLPRFWDVDQGAIRIGPHDVRDVSLRSLRAQIATVAQEPFLFAATVADNIGYGREGASRADIVAAATAAHAHAFITALPHGYDTPLGERGARLSGGQRQRLAIARALLRDAPLLIMDEATSSLDAHSEAEVSRALVPLLAGRTCLLIAHRLMTVREADSIAVLAGGHIVEQGSHRQLLAKDGAYARLLRLADRGCDPGRIGSAEPLREVGRKPVPVASAAPTQAWPA